MKKRKFAFGGFTGDGGATGGLNTVMEGAGQLKSSLGQIGQGLNGGGGGDMPQYMDQMSKLGLSGQGGGQQPDAAQAMQGLGFKKGGSVSSASRRGDGIATKGKTRGRMC